MSKEPDNVIHVSFGGDGRLKRAPATEARSDDGASGPEESARPRSSKADHPRRRQEDRPERRPEDPLADLYSRREVARLFGIPEGRLRYWARSGFLEPGARSGRRRYYTFQDLIGVRAAKGLMDAGVPFAEVRKSVEALRSAIPRCVRPLNELRITADGQTLVVKDDEGPYEPATGQRVLDFTVDNLRDDVVRVLRVEPRPEDRATAYELYLEGCRLDEDEGTYDQAEEAYRKAITLDPSLSNALTNLGNLSYRRGDVGEAELCYQKALEVDASQPEAHYNLGFLELERGHAGEAVERFERALDADPAFADAHFNVAMALEELGRLEEARPHWETYLALEPTGPWSEIARRHLG